MNYRPEPAILGLVALAMATLAPGHLLAKSDEPSAESILADLAKASSELEQTVKTFPERLKESISLKRTHEAELTKVADALDTLEATDGAAIDRERPAVQAACPPQMPPERVAACNAVRIPFNAKVDAFNIKQKTLQDQGEVVVAKERKRVEKIQQLKDKADRLEARVRALTATARAALIAECMKRSGGSLENAAHASSVCFDNADARITAVIGATAPRPPSSAVPNR